MRQTCPSPQLKGNHILGIASPVSLETRVQGCRAVKRNIMIRKKSWRAFGLFWNSEGVHELHVTELGDPFFALQHTKVMGWTQQEYRNPLPSSMVYSGTLIAWHNLSFLPLELEGTNEEIDLHFPASSSLSSLSSILGKRLLLASRSFSPYSFSSNVILLVFSGSMCHFYSSPHSSFPLIFCSSKYF